jgi:hypothetical protein
VDWSLTSMAQRCGQSTTPTASTAPPTAAREPLTRQSTMARAQHRGLAIVRPGGAVMAKDFNRCLLNDLLAEPAEPQ